VLQALRFLSWIAGEDAWVSVFFYPERSQKVIDINGLPLDKVEVLPDGSLKIGAVVRNSDLAHHAAVVRDYPVLSQALLSGALAQLSAWRRRDRLWAGVAAAIASAVYHASGVRI